MYVPVLVLGKGVVTTERFDVPEADDRRVMLLTLNPTDGGFWVFAGVTEYSSAMLPTKPFTLVRVMRALAEFPATTVKEGADDERLKSGEVGDD